jgi:hypothetical protein
LVGPACRWVARNYRLQERKRAWQASVPRLERIWLTRLGSTVRPGLQT